MVAQHIAIVQISHPGPTDESPYDEYWTAGLGIRLRTMYADLLGMTPIHIGYHKLVHEDGRIPEIGFEYSPEDVRPRWPDPAHPQQVHLDISVADLEAASALVVDRGARHLADADGHRVFEDPVGHPFCLYGGGVPGGAPGAITRIVFDCFSPRSLASFYSAVFDMPTRVVDTPTRVEIRGAGHRVSLAFQHSAADPPRWPDPSRPPQLHLDVPFEDASDIERAVALGAVHLPLDSRPDNHVYADPEGHPFCAGIGADDWLSGPAQVEAYQQWLARDN